MSSNADSDETGASIGPGGIEIDPRVLACLEVRELQLDQEELKSGAGGRLPLHAGASIGPGGIEIDPRVLACIEVRELQLDQEELK